LKSHAERRGMTRRVDVSKDLVGGDALTSSERRDCERIGEWAAGTGQYFALRCDGRGGLGTQGGRKRLFLLCLSPFWPVLGGTRAERWELRSMAARR
jgi:hypothetical protein